ncbi:MAG: SagB/ThcOx family dehydrogenase [Pseudomonadota bacterium]
MVDLHDALSNPIPDIPSGIRYRRARALAYFIDGEELIVFNFLTNRSFACNLNCLELLTQSADWQPLERIFQVLEDHYTNSLVEEVVKLFELTALVVEGDRIADLDEKYELAWEWGNATGLAHFSSKDNPTVTDQLASDIQVERSKLDPSPPLFNGHERTSNTVELPVFETKNELHAVMRMRRTIRAFCAEPIPLKAMSDILFAGLGIVSLVETPAGTLPLKMTPSPGARNPYEAYIYANNVAGLKSSTFYHYSSFGHALEPIANVEGASPTMSEMFALNQPWVEGAGAILVLVAHFDRVMWKYLNSSAYGSVLVEAGHVAQNAMLIATQHGLVANPSGAIAHSLIERAIGATQVTQSIVYALAIGVPDSAAESVKWLEPELSMRDRLGKEMNA